MTVSSKIAVALAEPLRSSQLERQAILELVGRTAKHIVILGDPHLPGRNIEAKKQVLQTINSWEDVDLVVVLGDLCADLGTAEEILFAREFFSALKKPTAFIHGNHDYVYLDARNSLGKRVMGPPGTRRFKLHRFQKTFAMGSLYYSRRVGDYLLIFLSADDLSGSATQFSRKQLDWWQTEMNKNKNIPTLVFSHAPMQGAMSMVREGGSAIAACVAAVFGGGLEWALPAGVCCDVLTRRLEGRHMAQPQDTIKKIVEDNPQLFLWASGHFHVTATNRSYNSRDNVYRKQVTLVHNSDMNGTGYHSPWNSWRHDTIWSNSLYLYPDKVEIKTYDHTRDVWLEKRDRMIFPRGME